MKGMEQSLILEQKPILGQRQIQSLEILQMNIQELESFLQERATENPLLEVEEFYRTEEESFGILKKLEWLKKSDEQNRVYYAQEQKETEAYCFQRGSEDLESYIMSQLIGESESQEEEKIYETLVYSLDECGYLTEIPEFLREKLSEGKLEYYVNKIKTCEPAGIGAKDLRECLLLQLERKGMLGGLEEKIIREYLEQVAKNEIRDIARTLKVSVLQTVEAVRKIRDLNPKPARGFSSRENLKYLYPDVTVVKFQDYFEILIDGEDCFKVHMNAYYVDMMKQEQSEEVKTYLNEKYNQARWILDAVDLRRETLLKITKILTLKQREFFEKGKGYLRPLTMAEVAEVLGIHESTISRAVREKYLQCAWGIYPLRYFFARGKAGGELSEKIKKRIEGFLETEDKERPLSDERIAEKLREQGIEISRRTVAKYRKELGIRDAKGRKEWKCF